MKTKLLKKLRKKGRNEIQNNINIYSLVYTLGGERAIKKAESNYINHNIDAIRLKYEAFSRKYRQKKKYKFYTTANIAYLVKRREYCKLALFLVRTFILFPIILILIVGMVLPGILIFHAGKILEIIGLFLMLRHEEANDEIWDMFNNGIGSYLSSLWR
jgi:hypothetical protein